MSNDNPWLKGERESLSCFIDTRCCIWSPIVGFFIGVTHRESLQWTFILPTTRNENNHETERRELRSVLFFLNANGNKSGGPQELQFIKTTTWASLPCKTPRAPTLVARLSEGDGPTCRLRPLHPRLQMLSSASGRLRWLPAAPRVVPAATRVSAYRPRLRASRFTCSTRFWAVFLFFSGLLVHWALRPRSSE